MNRDDHWEVTYYDKRQTRFPDMGKRHICDSESTAEIFVIAADRRRVDVSVHHYVDGKVVYSKYYE